MPFPVFLSNQPAGLFTMQNCIKYFVMLLGTLALILTVSRFFGPAEGGGVSSLRSFIGLGSSTGDSKQIKALTWNIAAINNNPFEYWITNDDKVSLSSLLPYYFCVVIVF
jgi:hypothetical protein